VSEEKVEKTPSGLLVVTEAEREAQAFLKELEGMAADLKPKNRGFRRLIGTRHHEILGVKTHTEVRMETPHKLTEEQRKERREDNKTMARSRKLHRRRKAHGRTR
jgi:hypothetical protein